MGAIKVVGEMLTLTIRFVIEQYNQMQGDSMLAKEKQIPKLFLSRNSF